MYDATYSVNAEDYSPENSGYIDAAQAVPEIPTHAQGPLDSSPRIVDAAYVPRPPDPAVGGMPGLSHGLGYSTGLRNSRAFRQAFDGRTLVVSNMGPHPVEGPVGYSTRSDRLTYGVQALKSDGLPQATKVQANMSAPNAHDIASAVQGNPNYV